MWAMQMYFLPSGCKDRSLSALQNVGGSYLTFPASWKIQDPGHQSPLSQDVMSDTEMGVPGREQEIALDSSTVWSVLSSQWTSFGYIFYSCINCVHPYQSDLIDCAVCACVCKALGLWWVFVIEVAGYVTGGWQRGNRGAERQTVAWQLSELRGKV